MLTTGGPRHAHIAGFDLHANVAVRPGEDERLEHLCCDILRPPVAQDALELTPDGKELLRLRRPWRDGTRAICFEPSEFPEKLAVMIPRPRINLLLYHRRLRPARALPQRPGPYLTVRIQWDLLSAVDSLLVPGFCTAAGGARWQREREWPGR